MHWQNGLYGGMNPAAPKEAVWDCPISKMLTELMGGKFEISLEDDLFRVKVTFRCKE